MTVLKCIAEIEMLCLNSKENFDDNKQYLKRRIEKSLKDQGFAAKRADNQDIKRLLGVYYEQNVTTEKYEDYDGERWIVFGDE